MKQYKWLADSLSVALTQSIGTGLNLEGRRQKAGALREMKLRSAPCVSAYCLLPTAYCLLPTAYRPPPSDNTRGDGLSLEVSNDLMISPGTAKLSSSLPSKNSAATATTSPRSLMIGEPLLP